MTAGEGFFFAFACLVVMGSQAYHWAAMQKRSHLIAALALRLDLDAWPDDSPPRDLDLTGTPFGRWSNLWNCYEGLMGRVPVAVFDFRVRHGKSGTWRTVVAVRSQALLVDHKPFELEVRSAGEWQIIYQPVGGVLWIGGLMPVEEIEELLQNLVELETDVSD